MGAVVVRPYDGIEFALVLDDVTGDPIREAIAACNYIYPPQFLSLLRWVQPEMTVVDVGAHIGTFALAAARCGAKVIAFEADAANFAVLCASGKANGFNNFEAVNCAIGAYDGIIDFVGGGPWGHCPPMGAPANAAAIAVAVTRLDAALSLRGIERVHFVKMDIEGSELFALQGMSRILSDSKGPALYVEANALSLGQHNLKQRDLIAALESYDYSCYEILDRLRPITVSDFQYNCNTDYFALKGVMRDSAQPLVGTGPRIDEIIAGVRFNSKHPNKAFRTHLVRELPEAAPEIRTHPEIIAVLKTMLEDDEEEVREGAGRLLQL